MIKYYKTSFWVYKVNFHLQNYISFRMIDYTLYPAAPLPDRFKSESDWNSFGWEEISESQWNMYMEL